MEPRSHSQHFESEGWLQGMRVISAARKVASQPLLVGAKRAKKLIALRDVTDSTAQLTMYAKAQAINVTEFITPEILAFCEQLALAGDDLKSKLRRESAANVHALPQFPLLCLLLNTQAEDGGIRKRQAHCGRQSFFESATECSCTACAQLLQKAVILRALGCSELKRSQIHWKTVVQTVMKADCAIPYAALLLFLNAAAALSLDADQQW
jgi:hypothetical protein